MTAVTARVDRRSTTTRMATPGPPASFRGHYCLGICPVGNNNEAWPNVITRITPSYYNVIAWFRANYP